VGGFLSFLHGNRIRYAAFPTRSWSFGPRRLHVVNKKTTLCSVPFIPNASQATPARQRINNNKPSEAVQMRLFGDFFPARFVLSPQVQFRGRQFDFEKLVVRSAGLFSRGARVATRFLSLFHGVLPSSFLFMVEVGDPRLALFGLSFFFGVWCVGALGRCSSLSSGIISARRAIRRSITKASIFFSMRVPSARLFINMCARDKEICHGWGTHR